MFRPFFLREPCPNLKFSVFEMSEVTPGRLRVSKGAT
jgi:hypothetical protein